MSPYAPTALIALQGTDTIVEVEPRSCVVRFAIDQGGLRYQVHMRAEDAARLAAELSAAAAAVEVSMAAEIAAELSAAAARAERPREERP